MNYTEMSNLIDRVIIPEIKKTRESGQAEYARNEEDVLANFKRTGKSLKLSPEKIIAVYMMKHQEGVLSYIDGYKSQREDVTGRLTDIIVYCCLLWAHVIDNQQPSDKDRSKENNNENQRP